jgi:hypothetical protein
MKPNVRAIVAAAAKSAIGGKNPTSIYDHSVGKYVTISGNVSNGLIDLYDHDTGCHFGGNLPSLYHYGVKSHIDLKISGTSFDGYDYDTRNHFSGSLSGSSVSIYDYEVGKHFSYS